MRTEKYIDDDEKEQCWVGKFITATVSETITRTLPYIQINNVKKRLVSQHISDIGIDLVIIELLVTFGLPVITYDKFGNYVYDRELRKATKGINNLLHEDSESYHDGDGINIEVGINDVVRATESWEDIQKIYNVDMLLGWCEPTGSVVSMLYTEIV